jgi:hypothetical protein
MNTVHCYDIHYTTLYTFLDNQRFQTNQRSTGDTINRSLQYTSQHLLLAALLLGRNDPEVAVGRVLLGCLGLGWSLLGDLAPAARSRISGTTALGWGGSVDEALVGEALAADELLGEVAGIDGAAAAVDGFSDELGFGGEEDEVGDKLFGCKE